MVRWIHQIILITTMFRVARRINEFSSKCIYCQEYKKTVENIALNLDTLKNLPAPKRKRPFKKLNPIVNHLQKEHKIVVPNQYAFAGIVIGLLTGAV